MFQICKHMHACRYWTDIILAGWGRGWECWEGKIFNLAKTISVSYTPTHAHTHTHTQACTHAHTHIHTHKHTHTRTHAHTHTHTHTHPTSHGAVMPFAAKFVCNLEFQHLIRNLKSETRAHIYTHTCTHRYFSKQVHIEADAHIAHCKRFWNNEN